MRMVSHGQNLGRLLISDRKAEQYASGAVTHVYFGNSIPNVPKNLLVRRVWVYVGAFFLS